MTALGSAVPVRRDGALLRWARFLPATLAEGPGLRAALWLQGCDVRCPGCFNPRLWAHRGGTLEAADAAADRFADAAVRAGAEGLTLLGGEPFDQAAAAASVARAFQSRGLTVMTFTGYPYERLGGWARDRADIAALLEETDLLADGPYLRDRPDARRPWIGSTNQGLRALSPVYADIVGEIEEHGGTDRIEVRIARDGSIAVNGWATDEALAALLDDLGAPARPARPAMSASAARTAPASKEHIR